MTHPFSEQPQKAHLRLIPAIDQWPRMIKWVDTFWGRLIFVGAFLLLLSSFSPELIFFQASWLNLAAVFCIGVLPLPPAQKISLGILLALLAGPATNFGWLLQHEQQKQIIDQTFAGYLQKWNEHPWIYALLSLGISLLLLGVCYQILRRLKTRLPALWLLLLWCGLLLILFNMPEGIATTIGWSVMGTFSISLFSLAFIQTTVSKKIAFSEWTSISLQAAFCHPPYPFIRHAQTFQKEEAQYRLKAIKLLLWSRMLAAVQSILVYFCISPIDNKNPSVLDSFRLGWTHFAHFSYGEYNALHFVWYQVIAERLLQTILALLYFSVNTGTGISILRLAGIYLPRAVCRPYLARSFNDFFRRALYYYSEILMHLFFYPIYEKLHAFIRNRKWRQQISLFISICLGGWLYHIVNAWPTFFFYGGNPVIQNFLSWLPYFAVIGLACCFSATGWISGRMKNMPWPIHAFLNLLIYSLLLVFIQRYVGENWSARMDLIRSMLPL